MNKYWWSNSKDGSGIHWKSWENLTTPKKFGGLGFRQIRDFNVALLGKQGWHLLANPNALVTRVLKGRYFPRTSFLQATLGHNPSYTWRSILASQELIRKGTRWRIGSDHQTSVFNDPWLPSNDNPYIESLPPDDMTNLRVADIRIQEGWNYDLLRDLFNERDQQLITQIPLSFRQ